VQKLLRIAVPLALGLAPAVALASGSAGHVRVTNCNTAQYKPSSITIACGDGNTFVENLKWSSWTQTSASGKGIYAFNDCKPDCVSGHLKTFATAVKLSHAQRCPKQKHMVFTDMALTFTGKRPTHSKRTVKLSLDCPF
jgi:hypothetical protein